MPKIIRILRSCSMNIFSKFPTVNISKLNFWLVICIAKNYIWTTLKVIFSIFRFFCTLRFQIFKYCSIITNHTSMESSFIEMVLCSRVNFTATHHRVHEEIGPAPGFSRDEVWMQTDAPHLKRVRQSDHLWGLDVVDHTSPARAQNRHHWLNTH